MKTHSILSLLVGASLMPLVGFAAEDAPPPGPGREKIREKVKEKMREHFEKRLDPSERERFQAAREKALADPQIAALRENAENANRAFFEAMREKMKEIDPGLEDIIRSAALEKGEHGPGLGKRGQKDGDRPPGFESLNENERQRLMAARQIALQAPSVQAAEQARANAQTPEERRDAGRAYFDAMHAAILQADPSLAPVLEKIRPDRKEKSE